MAKKRKAAKGDRAPKNEEEKGAESAPKKKNLDVESLAVSDTCISVILVLFLNLILV
jgi:hypothetical protein